MHSIGFMKKQDLGVCCFIRNTKDINSKGRKSRKASKGMKKYNMRIKIRREIEI